VPEEWNLVQNNSQQILVFCTQGPAHYGFCKGLIFAPSVKLASGVDCTIDNLLGASLAIAMSVAHSMFVLQAQNRIT
jgi:hypothetical protein